MPTQTNQDLLRAYLQIRLPEQYRSPEQVEAVLERCGGIFLYAFHFCRALGANVFSTIADLPDGIRFYPAYLARLRECVGELLYKEAYLPTLIFLSAAQQPVTLDQLASWGIPEDRLQFALIDLRDFLRMHRALRWQDSLTEEDNKNRYEIAHEAFVSFIRNDPDLFVQLCEAHAVIGQIAVTTNTGAWAKLSSPNEADLYNLRFVFTHLQEAHLTDMEELLCSDEDYASVCQMIGDVAKDKAKYQLAINLYDCALKVYEYLVHEKKLVGVVVNLAGTLQRKGFALSALSHHNEALQCFHQSLEEFRPYAVPTHKWLLEKGDLYDEQLKKWIFKSLVVAF